MTEKEFDALPDEKVGVYIGVAGCGCLVATVIDDPNMDMSEHIQEFVKQGLKLKKINLAEFRKMPFGCKCPK